MKPFFFISVCFGIIIGIMLCIYFNLNLRHVLKINQKIVHEDEVTFINDWDAEPDPRLQPNVQETYEVTIETNEPSVRLTSPVSLKTNYPPAYILTNIRTNLTQPALEKASKDTNSFLDPATLTLEERQYFVDLAYELVKANGESDRNNYTIELTDDFVFVTFHLPPFRFERIIPGPTFLLWTQINRKTGEFVDLMNDGG